MQFGIAESRSPRDAITAKLVGADRRLAVVRTVDTIRRIVYPVFTGSHS